MFTQPAPCRRILLAGIAILGATLLLASASLLAASSTAPNGGPLLRQSQLKSPGSGGSAATVSPSKNYLAIGGKDEIRAQDQQGLEG
jgi:hypothetical protein